MMLPLWSLLAVQPASAGLGPENVIVVVNADSSVSQTVANHYVNLRNVPAANVIMLKGVAPDALRIDLEQFKSLILRPVLEQINQRGLALQTRVIAYSAGFPTSVDISPHTDKVSDPLIKQRQRPTASINGLTYLYRFVLADDPGYLEFHSNLYCRGPFERHFANPFVGEKRERFKKAAQDLSEGRAAEAAEAFDSLFGEHPSLAPLAVRAAEAHMAADQVETAKESLRRAVGAGWRSAAYLKQSESLAPLLEDPDMASLRGVFHDLPMVSQEPVGFAADRGWTACGHSIAQPGAAIPYMLSCMLAVVHPRGSTVEQAVEVLNRAAGADQTFPEAAFWFTRTTDVRTKTRLPSIGDSLLWLKHLEQEADVVRAAVPSEAGECVGLMLGAAQFSLTERKWRFVPGALADNLTSFNGHFGTASQDKLTDLLHAGVAMTSGPVAEPYAIAQKFPSPMMYGFYASGATALESFYLSVHSPYQLLIVGDPLCQPFARSPREEVTIQLNTEPSRKIVIQRRLLPGDPPRSETKSIELFVDGKLIRRIQPVENVNIELPADASGQVNVRVVLIGDDPVEPRSWFSEWVDLKGPLAAPTVELAGPEASKTASDAAELSADENGKGLRVRLSAEQADSLELLHHGVSIASVQGKQGLVAIEPERLGAGPARLRPLAHIGEQRILGKPITIESSEP